MWTHSAARAFDEMRDDGGVRAPYRVVHDWLAKTPERDLERLSREAELLFAEGRPAEAYRKYRGRDPKVEALMKKRGF